MIQVVVTVSLLYWKLVDDLTSNLEQWLLPNPFSLRISAKSSIKWQETVTTMLVTWTFLHYFAQPFFKVDQSRFCFCFTCYFGICRRATRITRFNLNFWDWIKFTIFFLLMQSLYIIHVSMFPHFHSSITSFKATSSAQKHGVQRNRKAN